jgi:hypothetical protein
MDIKRNGSQPSGKGPAEWFTGNVRIDPLHQAPTPARVDISNPRDIGYYNPSGDLVFYYGGVGYFNGIVRIGQFDGNMDAITSQTGDLTATIELAN